MVRPLAYHYYATSPIESHIQIPSPKNSHYLHHQNISPSIYDTTNIANPLRYSPRNSLKQRQYTLLEEPIKNESSLPPRPPTLKNTTVARVRRSILKNTIPVAPLIGPKASMVTHHTPQLFSQPIAPAVRKKQSFDTSIEHICLFSKNDTPKTILVSPRHTEQDLGDEFALTGSASPSSSSSSEEELFNFDLELDDDRAKINRKKNDIKGSSTWEINSSNVSNSYSSKKHLIPTPKVSMESLGIGSTSTTPVSSSSTFSGTVLVENLSPIKQVIIRLTINNWKDFQDYPCKYQNVGFAGTERFSVSVPLETIFAEKALTGKDNEHIDQNEMLPVSTGLHKAHFAVCYIDGSTDPREYWDNNSGMNYFVEFKKIPIAKSASSSKSKPRSSTIPTRTNTFKSWNFRPASQQRKIVTRSPKVGGITSPVSESPTENGKWFRKDEKKEGEEKVGSLEIPYSKKASEYYLTHLAHL